MGGDRAGPGPDPRRGAPAGGLVGAGDRPLTTAREALVRDATGVPELDALPARYAGAADAFLAGLLEAATGGDVTGVALVAVGGYGRAELFPGSDLDVVLVHRQRRDVARLAERIWYAVWDDGTRLDHSVRTAREALAVARDDLRAALGLLDARVVAGDPTTGDDLVRRSAEQLRACARQLLPELSESVAARHVAAGEVAFLLEPDLKEAHGGLRDVHAIRAAAALVPQLAPALGSAELGEAAAALARARVALHVVTGRSGDRLSLENQDEVAARVGLGDADDLMRLVAAAGREVAWASDEAWRRVRSWLKGPAGRAARDRPLAPGLVLRDGEIALAGPPAMADDPSLVVRAAALAAEEGHPFAPGFLERAGAALRDVPEPWPDEIRHAFLSVLGGREQAVTVLESLDRSRILERLLPEWSAVRNRPQRNAYHRFTVDRHLIEAVARAGALARRVSRPDLLLVGALLHDIGKGYPGDHTEAGVRIAPAIATRMGFDETDTGVVTRLVQHHLLLAETATRRDLDDPATVASVAEAVGDRPTLDLLAALTQADGEATGAAAWGTWKAQLVGELVVRVAQRLGPGQPIPPAPAGPFRRPLPVELAPFLAAGRLGVHVADEGLWSTVTVVAPDRPGLLADVAGVLALHRLDVRAAAASLDGAAAIERFAVERPAAAPVDLPRLEADLQAVLAGTLLLEARLAERARSYTAVHRRMAAGPAEVVVSVDNAASDRATLVEVRAPDSRGLLHIVAGAIARQGLDVSSAHVSTLGHEVVDTFYVTFAGRGGGKLLDPAATAALREEIAAAIAGPRT